MGSNSSSSVEGCGSWAGAASPSRTLLKRLNSCDKREPLGNESRAVVIHPDNSYSRGLDRRASNLRLT